MHKWSIKAQKSIEKFYLADEKILKSRLKSCWLLHGLMDEEFWNDEMKKVYSFKFLANKISRYAIEIDRSA